MKSQSVVFSIGLVINRGSILAIHRVWFFHSGLELGMILRESYFFNIINLKGLDHTVFGIFSTDK